MSGRLVFTSLFACIAAGGLLLAGPDPTSDDRVLPGCGDQRDIERLVQTGFSPVEAIRIATLNGATYLNRADQIIEDIENGELVVKDGFGDDAPKLLDYVRGRYGQY